MRWLISRIPLDIDTANDEPFNYVIVFCLRSATRASALV